MAQRRQIQGGEPGTSQMDNAPQGGPLGPGGGDSLNMSLPNEPAPGSFPNNGGYDPTGEHYQGPSPLPHGPETGQSSESPRERGGQAVPRRPGVPTPAPSNTAQLIPFSPMGDTSANTMATGASRRSPGLFGSAGGLQGGGLGVPQDPINSAQNMDISGLIQMLLKGQ